MRLPGSHRLRGVTGFIKTPGPTTRKAPSGVRTSSPATNGIAAIYRIGHQYGAGAMTMVGIIPGFTNLWYTFEYRCQDGTRPALDMDLTKGRLEVEQVE
jgi:hypothetical protein